VAIAPEEIEDSETKVTHLEGTYGANIGRAMIGWIVGIEALGSP
jgi:hypothetical protein